MPGKPSKNEQEYIQSQERALMQRRKERAAKEAEEKRRQMHYMKCPKCGGDLVVEEFRFIEVDRCPDCNGVWFDCGEVEAILDREAGEASSIFRSIVKVVRR